jgi:hypothetical protein
MLDDYPAHSSCRHLCSNTQSTMVGAIPLIVCAWIVTASSLRWSPDIKGKLPSSNACPVFTFYILI